MPFLRTAESDRADTLARASVVYGMIGVPVWQTLMKRDVPA